MAASAQAGPRPAEYDAAEDAWRANLWNYAYMMSGGAWVPYRPLRIIADAVQAAIARGGGRIIINIPPRHGKSELISHWLPTWFLDMYPRRRVILASYGEKLASDWSRKVRDELALNERSWTKISRNKDSAVDWRTVFGGGMRAAGVGGPIIGFGADLFLIDDPHKSRAEVFSPTLRSKVVDWFLADVYSRLEPGATIVLIMQRWHEKDLTGYLMNEHEDEWSLIKLPALAEEDDPMDREPGEALIPERYDVEALTATKRAVGSMVWSGMFQQRPAPVEGNVALRDWFRYYVLAPSDIKRVVVSWDMSFKQEGKSWCVGQAWYQKGARHYLLAQERGKWDFTQALKKVVAFHNYCTEEWKHVKETIIEEAANGFAIISTLKGRLPRIQPIRASASKLERLSNAAPSIECGDVYLPDKSIAPWVDDLVEEIVTFPNSENDDQMDALTQYVNRHKTEKVGGIKLNLDIGLGVPEWKL